MTRERNERKSCREQEKDEYEQRLVPASNEEIVALAEKLWANLEIRASFERVGLHGDFTEAEQAAVKAAIAEYRQGPLWDRDDLNLALAPCLARKLAAGEIDRLDAPDALAFLEDRKVERMGRGMRPKKVSAKEVMTFAHAVRNDPHIWQILVDAKAKYELSEEEDGAITGFETAYRYKYGLMNRSTLRSSGAIDLLRRVATGRAKSYEDEKSWDHIRSFHTVRD